MQMHLERH